jgi:hypothetical protein
MGMSYLPVLGYENPIRSLCKLMTPISWETPLHGKARLPSALSNKQEEKISRG